MIFHFRVKDLELASSISRSTVSPSDMSDCEATAENEIGGSAPCYILFLEDGRLVLRKGESEKWAAFASNSASRDAFKWVQVGSEDDELYFACAAEAPIGEGVRIATLLEAEHLSTEGEFEDSLSQVLPKIRANAIRVPYLYFSESEYIYRFRTEKQRNSGVYNIDDESARLYQSSLCVAIKELKRSKERSATTPAVLDFGAVKYILPSHFGFCLGVRNAIERAYETIAENPDKRVFMLSELIHNPFVNEDMSSRGLRYLQSDKGVAIIDPADGRPYWDSITSDDIVIIPAFGARDEDKVRLIERGISLNPYDATCMLVEKVWKAAKRYGQKGYTVVIHGKAEHEETKATFSNSARYAPSLVVRDLNETAILEKIILSTDEEEKRRLFEPFVNRATPGFDPLKNLEKLAFVNQTTLLRNETIKIIDYLSKSVESRYGQSEVESHVELSSKGDTLCYATQVNQDALAKALEEDVDIALVVGGKNSSNTFQLYRLCAERFGEHAHYIQSEKNIESADRVQHFVFPYQSTGPKIGQLVERAFLPGRKPLTVLLTGGASCPDGILQQIIARINGFFPADSIRSVEEVLAELEEQ